MVLQVTCDLVPLLFGIERARGVDPARAFEVVSSTLLRSVSFGFLGFVLLSGDFRSDNERDYQAKLISVG